LLAVDLDVCVEPELLEQGNSRWLHFERVGPRPALRCPPLRPGPPVQRL